SATEVPACHKLILSVHHIQHGRKPLQGPVESVKEKRLEAKTAVVLTKKTVSSWRDVSNELLAFRFRWKAWCSWNNLENLSGFSRIRRGYGTKTADQRY